MDDLFSMTRVADPDSALPVKRRSRSQDERSGARRE
jgi:hypothetical protein